MGKDIHVTHRANGDWATIGAKDDKASRLFDTLKEAINYGRGLAQNNKSELVIHGLDNKIRDKDSFGNDSFPPAG